MGDTERRMCETIRLGASGLIGLAVSHAGGLAPNWRVALRRTPSWQPCLVSECSPIR